MVAKMMEKQVEIAARLELEVTTTQEPFVLESAAHFPAIVSRLSWQWIKIVTHFDVSTI